MAQLHHLPTATPVPEQFDSLEQIKAFLALPMRSRETALAFAKALKRSQTYNGLRFINDILQYGLAHTRDVGPADQQQSIPSPELVVMAFCNSVETPMPSACVTLVNLLHGDNFSSGGIVSTDSGEYAVKLDNYGWWRDFQRAHLGLPGYTIAFENALQRHNIWQYLPCVDANDKFAVSYIPDRDSADRDRRVVTTPEKFLRKVLPFARDEYIRELCSEHKANMDDRVHIIQYTSWDDRHVFTNAIRHGAANSGSCMRQAASVYAGSGYTYRDETPHPVWAYLAPGFGVATLRQDMDNPSPTGADVIARAITWVNPADPTDKRYTRIYPANGGAEAARLRKNLESQGYRNLPLTGARLRAIPLAVGELNTQYLMPYLDACSGDNSQTRHGKHVKLSAPGTEFAIEICDRADYDANADLSRVTGNGQYYVAGAGSTGGAVNLGLAPVSEWHDTLTGETRTYHADGRPVTVLLQLPGYATLVWAETTPQAAQHYLERANAETTDPTVSTFCQDILVDVNASQVVRSNATNLFRSVTTQLPVLDTAENRAALGFKHPDAELYPDDAEEWVVPGTSKYSQWIETYDDRVIQRDDAVDCIRYTVHGATSLETMHKSVVPKKAAKTTRIVANRPCFIYPDVPKDEIVKLASGRTAVLGVHKVVHLWEGGYALYSTATRTHTNALNSAQVYTTGGNPTLAKLNYDHPDGYWQRIMVPNIRASVRCGADLQSFVRSFPEGSVWHTVRHPSAWSSVRYQRTWEQLVVTAAEIAAEHMPHQYEDEVQQAAHTMQWKAWAKLILHIEKLRLEEVAAMEAEQATADDKLLADLGVSAEAADQDDDMDADHPF